MMAITTQTVEDLRASRQNCRLQMDDCKARCQQQQTILAQLQAERATFDQRQAAREQEQAAFRPQVREASEILARAQDYAKAASGSIKNAAYDEVLAAEELHNEMRARLQEMVEQHLVEQKVDQPFIDDVDANIRSAKLAISQLEAQQTALLATSRRLHAELGQATYDLLSGTLKPARETVDKLETESNRAQDIYARMRAESFPRLDEWPDFKRKLQAENQVSDDTVVNALTLFLHFCELLAKQPIQDPEIARLFTFENYIYDEWQGRTNTLGFEEQARVVRLKLAELQYMK